MTTLVRFGNRLAQDHLDQLFASCFAPLPAAARGAHPIRLDAVEDDKAYHVTASLPGAAKDKIDISVDGNEITIAADLPRAAPAEGQRVLLAERLAGKTARVFTVGQEIDEDQVEARYADGVLTLTLPKKVQPGARRINVA